MSEECFRLRPRGRLGALREKRLVERKQTLADAVRTGASLSVASEALTPFKGPAFSGEVNAWNDTGTVPFFDHNTSE